MNNMAKLCTAGSAAGGRHAWSSRRLRHNPTSTTQQRCNSLSPGTRGVVGRGGDAVGRRPLTFFRQGGGTRLPLPPLFWTEIRAKVSTLLQLVSKRSVRLFQYSRINILRNCKSLSKSCFMRPPTSFLGLHPCRAPTNTLFLPPIRVHTSIGSYVIVGFTLVTDR